MKYTCEKCGKVVTGIYKESPQYGSFYTVSCPCGNKGNARNDWKYEIKGFERKENHIACPCSTCIHDRPGEDKCAMGKVISIRPIGCKLKEER